MTVTDEVWARIAPRSSWGRGWMDLVLVAAIVLCGVAIWWSDAAFPRLSATPIRVEPGPAAGLARLHADLYNESMYAVRPSSVSPGTTLPVRGMDSDLPGYEQEGELPQTSTRPLVLELEISCGIEPRGWDLEMVVYGPLGGREVPITWRDDRLPDWRRKVIEAACPAGG